MRKKIFILCAHPNTDSLSGALSSAYEEAAAKSGYAVRRMNIGSMHFDPVLRKGYKAVQALEPDLLRFQRNVKWADHIVLLYPNWWGAMPAVTKGLFDRAWLPGFAFNFDKKTRKPISHLAGKTARIIIASGAHSVSEGQWCHCGECGYETERSIMGLAGIAIAFTVFGQSEYVTDEARRAWLQEVRALGEKGK